MTIFIELLEETNNNILTTTRRGLKGGATYHGGSGSIIGTIVITIILVITILLCSCVESGRKKRLNEYDESIKEEVMTYANEKSRSVVGMHTPTDGVYEIKCLYQGSIQDAIATLTFTDNGQGYDLTGTMEHSNKKSLIKDSIIAYDGKAYWKCVEFSGKKGITLVSKGDFDFENNNFSGTWRTRMVDGPYTHFQFLHPITSSAPAQYSSAQ